MLQKNDKVQEIVAEMCKINLVGKSSFAEYIHWMGLACKNRKEAERNQRRALQLQAGIAAQDESKAP